MSGLASTEGLPGGSGPLLTAAVSAKTYWLPRYMQAKAATTVTMKLKMVMTTAFTERTGGERGKVVDFR